MTTYTRVTVLAGDRKAELVVPNSQTVAALMPDLLRLLEHAPAPVALTRALGTQLDLSRTLADQDVEDGCALWLTPVDQAPAPPEVTDITDLTAQQHAARPDLWTPGWTLALVTVVAAAMAWLTGHALLADVGHTPVALTGAGVAVAATLAGRRGQRAAAIALTGAGAGVGLALGPALVSGQPALMAVAASLALAAGVVAVVSVAGLGEGGLGGGAGVGAALALGLVVPTFWGADARDAAAVVAVITALVLALAPGLAMTLSGLAGLDDRTSARDEAPRPDAARTVTSAYRALTATTVAGAALVALCGALLAGPGPWARALVLLLVLTTALRARVLPLVGQRSALVVAATTLAVVQVLSADAATQVTFALAVLAGALYWALGNPSRVLRARLNRAGDVIETIALVVLVPVLLGYLGVFADLAGAFS
ncbi:EsaB/YukD family protein [Oerskovia merdavium]|uniref:EsaB/YukD family protein n=1 Tax=Oerskovia merdavium TaxID=2762227 RepID=A0ABR8U4D1_9CELL|nr:EsaB/YukD family protein [Oerskovia merdavium]MBD7982900.1 EsaB/YukD family protein [Oerskovia merdavium]